MAESRQPPPDQLRDPTHVDGFVAHHGGDALDALEKICDEQQVIHPLGVDNAKVRGTYDSDFPFACSPGAPMHECEHPNRALRSKRESSSPVFAQLFLTERVGGEPNALQFWFPDQAGEQL